MIEIFMRSPIPNTLALLTLIALAVTWFTSIALSLGSSSTPLEKGWFRAMLPAFSVLGIPAAVDLLQTTGATFLFAAIVLIVLLLNIVVPILKANQKSSHPFVIDWYKWSVLISSIGGLAVSGYLTFIESTGGPVACGPSGGCDAVQNSRYATLFGFLPVGVLGLLGYVSILAGWIALHYGPLAIRKLASITIWAMCIFGVLFSTYLTFLEPFVIGATCMWCILSAVLMIILLLVTTPDAHQAFAISDD